MDNFEPQQEAARLADSHSAYMLAKMLLIEQKERIDLAAHVERLKTAKGKRNAAHAAKAKAEEADLAAAQELDEAKAERDKLAAHVERLKTPAVKLAATVENKDDLPLHKWALKCAQLVADVQKSVDDTPATSLARRDKIQQARALEALSAASGGASAVSRKSIDNIAADLRRQIKENN